ncbi:MAG: NAD(P)/FAD-dependent oxidoreductase [Chloroflexota bacterium]
MDANVIIIGGGISGMATALRLQARGVTTMVLEAHGQVGGCAGFFRKRGFAFDVGATTLVDFEPDGVGGQFLREIGLDEIDGEILPGYQAWLPDRLITLHRDPTTWQRERLRAFGDTVAYRRFWRLLDHLAALFWEASRQGIKLPIHSASALWKASRLIPPKHWGMVRYLTWTMADALKACGLEQDRALRQFLGMLIQDTVHATVEAAPLINSALGVTIRGAGLMRSDGGMHGFWQTLVHHYRQLGGTLRVGTRVEQVCQTKSGFTVNTRRGAFQARQVVSTLPIWNTAQLGMSAVTRALQPYLHRDKDKLGGAVVVFLGVPDAEVQEEKFTHHQILIDYAQPLQNGNNMFISVSAPEDVKSAPHGWRAVMLSTHCDLADWEGLSEERYLVRKREIGQRLIDYARRVYPSLGKQAKVLEVGTPLTYAKYTHRHRGAVGGIRLSLRNSNQFAVPYNLGISGFWQAGDTTWPGLGTVACVLGSRHIADAIISGGS